MGRDILGLRAGMAGVWDKDGREPGSMIGFRSTAVEGGWERPTVIVLPSRLCLFGMGRISTSLQSDSTGTSGCFRFDRDGREEGATAVANVTC